MEEVEVERWKAYQEVEKSESIKRMKKIWLDKYVDKDSLVIFYGEKI